MNWEIVNGQHNLFEIILGRHNYHFDINNRYDNSTTIDSFFGLAVLKMEREVAKYKVIMVDLYWLHIHYGYLTNPKEYEKSKVMESLK